MAKSYVENELRNPNWDIAISVSEPAYDNTATPPAFALREDYTCNGVPGY